MSYFAIAPAALLLSYLGFRIWVTFGSLPKVFVLSSPSSILQQFSINVKPFMWDHEWQWREGYMIFQRLGSTVISVISLRLFQGPELIIADPILIKQIVADRHTFPKPGGLARAVPASFGQNLLSTEGDQWRRHRRIAGPAFSERHHRLVWQAASDITLALFDKWTKEADGKDVVVPNFDEITAQLTLKVFCSAGFNLPSPWHESILPPGGHTLTFEDTLRTFIESFVEVYLFPPWLLKRFARGRKVALAASELQLYLDEIIMKSAMRLQHEEKTDDLLSFLVDAGVEAHGEGSENRLSRREITGNILIFLIGGHETTAHALAFTFARLALHREEQDALYEHIRSIVSEGGLPKYEDVPKLKRVLAVMYETLRVHPIVSSVNKVASKDCTVQSSQGPLAIPRGTRLHIDIVGTHFNPDYWDKPNEYRPSRFLEDYNKDAFIPFSLGARGCIGRRFSEVEAVTVISLILLNYSVEVTDDPQFSGESSSERAARVLDWYTPGLLTPKKVPLTFKPRKVAL